MYEINFKKLIIKRLILFMALLMPHTHVTASSINATMQVSATVVSNCQLNDPTMQFGTYDASSNNDNALHAVGSLQIRCTKFTTAMIALNNGEHSYQAIGTTRAMSNSSGNDFLSYDLYTNSNYNSIWNNTNNIDYISSSSGFNTVNIYGKIPANQNVKNGVYRDTIVVTANF